jgi:hypothetical protein
MTSQTETTPEQQPAPAKKMKTPRPASEGKRANPPKKRGPPRPHRKLPQEILEGRIEKLKKRIERASGQLDDAKRHVEGYEKEYKYREQDKE